MADDDDGGFGDYDPEADAGQDELDVASETDVDEDKDEKDEPEDDKSELSGEESDADEGAEIVADIDDEDDGRENDDEESLAEVPDGSIRVRFAPQTKPRVDAIEKMSNSHRKIIIVADDERITSNILQKSEAARIDAVRAKQMESSPTIFVDASGVHDSVTRARMEREALRCPLILRRCVGRGTNNELICEDFKVREMVQPSLN